MIKHVTTADVSNVSSIGKTGGIYLFYGNNELLYLGKAGDLRTRIVQHLHGKANTADICKYFKSVAVIYIDDKVSRDIMETMLINLWKPKLNVDKAWTYTTDKWSFLESDEDYMAKQMAEQRLLDDVYMNLNI